MGQRIEAKATPQRQVAAKLEAAEAKLGVFIGIARGVADIAQVAFARLERDLQNIGLKPEPAKLLRQRARRRRCAFRRRLPRARTPRATGSQKQSR